MNVLVERNPTLRFVVARTDRTAIPSPRRQFRTLINVVYVYRVYSLFAASLLSRFWCGHVPCVCVYLVDIYGAPGVYTFGRWCILCLDSMRHSLRSMCGVLPVVNWHGDRTRSRINMMNIQPDMPKM